MDENNTNAQEINGQDLLNNLTDEESIDIFIWGIMDEAGVKDGTPEILQGVHDDLRDQLMAQIDRSLIAELPDDKLEEFNKIAEEQGKIDPDTLAQAGVDVQAVAAGTMDKCREIYLHGSPETNETEQENHGE